MAALRSPDAGSLIRRAQAAQASAIPPEAYFHCPRQACRAPLPGVRGAGAHSTMAGTQDLQRFVCPACGTRLVLRLIVSARTAALGVRLDRPGH